LKTITLLLFTITLAISSSVYSQHTQTNAPQQIYPLLDDYIKRGYERNYRVHTRVLKRLDFIYLIDTPATKDRVTLPFSQGDHLTVIVYKYMHRELNEWRYVMAINEMWAGNPYVMRRLFYKGMLMVHEVDLKPNSFGIDSDRVAYDFKLIIDDLTENNWEEKLTDFYNLVSTRLIYD
jgi:sulfur transfer complex TusBCD TusB component (DsrH family)